MRLGVGVTCWLSAVSQPSGRGRQDVATHKMLHDLLRGHEVQPGFEMDRRLELSGDALEGFCFPTGRVLAGEYLVRGCEVGIGGFHSLHRRQRGPFRI